MFIFTQSNYDKAIEQPYIEYTRFTAKDIHVRFSD